MFFKKGFRVKFPELYYTLLLIKPHQILNLILLHYHKLVIYLGNDCKEQKGCENRSKSKNLKYANAN